MIREAIGFVKGFVACLAIVAGIGWGSIMTTKIISENSSEE